MSGFRDLLETSPALTKSRPVAVQDDDARHFGAAMADCTEKERAFVEFRFEGNSIAERARLAGYGNADSSAATFARIGNRLVNRDRVIDAMIEVSRKMVRSAAPEAVRVVNEVMADKHNPKRLAAAAMVFDRVDPVVTKQDINVRHKIVDHDAEAIKQLRALKALEVAKDKLIEVFGEFGLHRLEARLQAEDAAKQPVIEAEFTELNSNQEEW